MREGEILRQSVLFDRRELYLVSPAGRLIGHGNDPNDIVTSLNQLFETLDGKIGRPHIYDAQLFFFHVVRVLVL